MSKMEKQLRRENRFRTSDKIICLKLVVFFTKPLIFLITKFWSCSSKWNTPFTNRNLPSYKNNDKDLNASLYILTQFTHLLSVHRCQGSEFYSSLPIPRFHQAVSNLQLLS